MFNVPFFWSESPLHRKNVSLLLHIYTVRFSFRLSPYLFLFLRQTSCTCTLTHEKEKDMTEKREGWCINWDNSRVAEAPAQIPVCEGKERVVEDS